MEFAASKALPSLRVRLGTNRLYRSRVTTGLLCPSIRATQLMFSPPKSRGWRRCAASGRAAGSGCRPASTPAPRPSSGRAPASGASAWSPGRRDPPAASSGPSAPPGSDKVFYRAGIVNSLKGGLAVSVLGNPGLTGHIPETPLQCSISWPSSRWLAGTLISGMGTPVRVKRNLS
jgi:hypothetical protein